MKKLGLVLCMSLLCCGLALAGDVQNFTPVQLTNISILSTNQSTATQNLGANGWIECLFVGITNSISVATNTVTVAVQVYDGMDIWRTVYTNTGLSASTVVYPRVAAQSITGAAGFTNAPVRIPLYAEKIKVTAYNAGLSTNTNVKVWGLVSLP